MCRIPHEKEDEVYEYLNEMSMWTGSQTLDEKFMSDVIARIDRACEDIRVTHLLQPRFEVHAIGEADGDLTWYLGLTDEERTLLNRDTKTVADRYW